MLILNSSGNRYGGHHGEFHDFSVIRRLSYNKYESHKYGINDNITCIDFTQYHSFYYFNPFCEQVASSDRIDKTTTFSSEKMIYIKSMLLNS